MANKTVITRKYVVTTRDHGANLVLGNASDNSDGWWELQFVRDGSFAGEFGVMARSGVREAGDGNDDVAFQAIGYRNMADPSVTVTDPVTPDAIIYVPTGALFLGLLTSCTAGTCTIYSRPLLGPVAF